MNVRTVLFLCSGNYYRSRFAEGLFNHLARERAIAWRATSAGLKIDLTRKINIGPLSRLTLDAFQRREILAGNPLPFPRQLTLEDLAAADLVIAMKEAEHRALMRKNFPEWENRVTYWHVHDLDKAPPEETIRETETLVRGLFERLATQPHRPVPALTSKAE